MKKKVLIGILISIILISGAGCEIDEVSKIVEEPEEPRICTNTCAIGYNQRPHPDCNCYKPEITPTDTDVDGKKGCIKSPAFDGDLCSGYRCMKNGKNIGACYSFVECEDICNDLLSYECFSDDDCDDDNEETIDFCENPSSKNAKCMYKDTTDKCNIINNVIINGNPKDKLDIVFVPVGFDNYEEFSSTVLEHIDVDGKYKGLLYFEPFKSNHNKFNFFKTQRLPTVIENDFIQKHCTFSSSSYTGECIRNIKNWLSENNCIYDKVITIFKQDKSTEQGGGWAEALNGVLAVSPDRLYPPFDIQGHITTVHEFTHLLGLTDGYIRYSEFGIYGESLKDIPNCDVMGCPKWCQDYIKQPSGAQYLLCKDLLENECKQNINCFWRNKIDEYFNTQCVPIQDADTGSFGGVNIGLNCLEGTGCYYNCNGVGAWRSVTQLEEEDKSTSLMFYFIGADEFSVVERRYLESVLSK